MMELRIFAVLGWVWIAACGSPTSPSRDAVFAVNSCPHQPGETFRILLRDPDRIREAERLVGKNHIVRGITRAGDGGFNAPWSWHMDPDTVRFPEVTVELCSGCASFLEASPAVWNGADFCPLGAVIVARER